jgi:DNA-binding MarR family transcriptional regulator
MTQNIEMLNYTVVMTRTGRDARPEACPDACSAWQLLVRFFWAQRSHLPILAAELQLSPAQCHLLRAIEPGRPIPMRHAAQALACDASNVTGLVDRLESRGLIRRRPSDEDRRVTMLELTPTGSRLRALLLDRMSAPPAALQRLSVQDQRTLERILTLLLE